MTAASGASPWTSGDVHADAIVAVAVLAFAYLRAWRARGVTIPWTIAWRGIAALGVTLLAVSGPLHALSERYLFSAHMVQHLLLTLVVPPLALTGMPAFMIDALLAPWCRRPFTRSIVRWITRPIPALAAYAGVLVLWHLPVAYDRALGSHLWHLVEHVMLVGGAVLGWWPVLSRSTRAPALPYAAQILYLFAFGMPMTVVAAMVTATDDVLYRFYETAPRILGLAPLDDQRLGGLIMWVPAGLVPLIVFTAVFFRWVASEPD
ncbi:MAG: cytochrome c oxidase assembly protein [Candidatus Rokuibacteriota bacterium]|nr:MAG: cytochrome c oxidase assembly protein [Candidatus Rokubacteria bacterium]